MLHHFSVIEHLSYGNQTVFLSTLILSLAIPKSWCEFPVDQYGPSAIVNHCEDDLNEKTAIIGIETT